MCLNYKVKKEIDDEILYQITVLRAMINELPLQLGSPITSQLELLLSAMDKSTVIIKSIMSSTIEELESLHLTIKYLQFDLDSTKKERDDLRDQMGR